MLIVLQCSQKSRTTVSQDITECHFNLFFIFGYLKCKFEIKRDCFRIKKKGRWRYFLLTFLSFSCFFLIRWISSTTKTERKMARFSSISYSCMPSPLALIQSGFSHVCVVYSEPIEIVCTVTSISLSSSLSN